MPTIQARIDSYARQFDRRRATIFDVQAVETAEQITLSGEVLERAQHAAVLEIVQGLVLPVEDTIVVLREQSDFGYGVVRFGVLDVRFAPSRGEELVTEALYGEPVEIIRRREDWLYVRLSDGYLGWVRENGVTQTTEPSQYRAAASHVVARRLQPVMGMDGKQIGLLPWGVRVPVDEFRDGKAFFMSPDEVPCVMDADTLMHVAEMPNADLEGIHDLLEIVQQWIGVPYLWGGVSTFGFDCSGFAQAAYRLMGISIPRDADQQAQHGHAVGRDQIQAGDLIFWAVERNAEDYRLQKITHVSIALDAEQMIHANQRLWSVSIDPIEDVQQRYVDNGDPGIVSIQRVIEGV